jgi:hypothetical protein
VQEHVDTRSSGQIRSHAQKFFEQLKKKGGFVEIRDVKRNQMRTYQYHPGRPTECYTRPLTAYEMQGSYVTAPAIGASSDKEQTLMKSETEEQSVRNEFSSQ